MNTEEMLKRLESIESFFQGRMLQPSFDDYRNSKSDGWDALTFFVRGYAFEHLGRSPSFAPIATDVLKALKSEGWSLDNPKAAQEVWGRFKKQVDKPNVMVNPLAPKDTPFQLKGKPKLAKKHSVIEFAQQAVQGNIVDWTVEMLKQNQAEKAHGHLRKDINGISNKIASLWLRDIAYLFDIKPLDNRELLFPVDTWVRRTVAILAGNEKYNKPKYDLETATWSVRECSKLGLSPEKVNMGFWYMGAEISDSEYLMRNALRDEKLFDYLVTDHLRRMRGAVEYAESAPRSWLGKVSRENHCHST